MVGVLSGQPGSQMTSRVGWIAFIMHKIMVKLQMKQNMEIWVHNAQIHRKQYAIPP